MSLMTVWSFLRHCFTWPRLAKVTAPASWLFFCAVIRSWQNDPSDASKKLVTPTLMSCRSTAPQYHSLSFMIGPPSSTAEVAIFFSGLPERKPLAPAVNSSSVTLSDCILSFSNVPLNVPLNTLLPLLVTRLIARPDDCTETSPPPVVTWICSNESKLKYDGEEFDDRSVIDPPST